MHSSEEWKTILKIEKLYFYNIFDLVYAADYFKYTKILLNVNKPMEKFIYKNRLDNMAKYIQRYLDTHDIPDEIQEIIINDYREHNNKIAVHIIIHYYRKYCIKKYFQNSCERFLKGDI